MAPIFEIIENFTKDDFENPDDKDDFLGLFRIGIQYFY